MRLGAPLSFLVLALGLGSAAPASSAEQAASCRGLPATIEGSSNQTITGTPGDDVIVAPYGSYGSVDAGAGNDVVCVVAGAAVPDYPEFPSYSVQAGHGDDVIDSTALPVGHASLFVPSSAGRDAFYGGPEDDRVTIPAVNGVPPVDDTEADVFVTGGGADVVMSGSLGFPNGDVIDVGAGGDVVLYAGTGASGDGTVTGGPGRDSLLPTANDPVDPPDDPLPPGDVVVDARTGSATVGGAAYLTWSGIEAYELGDIKQNHVTFVGSPEPEHVTLSRGTVEVRMGGGNDTVSHYYASLPNGSVAGGRGRDHLDVDVRGSARVDLATAAVVHDRGVRTRLGLAGFEDAEVLGRSVLLLGTAGDNHLRAVGRKLVEVAGRAGADRLRPGINTVRGLLRGNERTARGGPGRDVLTGTPRGDVLRGGPGPDTANGGAGRDLCVTEVRVACELP